MFKKVLRYCGSRCRQRKQLRQLRRARRSIVLDNQMTAKEILETYDNIVVIQVYPEDWVMFRPF